MPLVCHASRLPRARVSLVCHPLSLPHFLKLSLPCPGLRRTAQPCARTVLFLVVPGGRSAEAWPCLSLIFIGGYKFYNACPTILSAIIFTRVNIAHASLVAIGGQTSKDNFVFPRLFESVLEFSKGPTRIQGYSGWEADRSFVQMRRLFDFCSVKLGDDISEHHCENHHRNRLYDWTWSFQNNLQEKCISQ